MSQIESARDPRLDPCPGDWWANDNYQREVSGRHGDLVKFKRYRNIPKGRRFLNHDETSLSDFSRWCEGAVYLDGPEDEDLESAEVLNVAQG